MIIQSKKRRATKNFNLNVIRKQSITPHMMRITLGGNQLATFPEEHIGGYVKLHLTNDGTDCMRTYTVRDHKPESQELDIDFVLHEESGPAAQWALDCQVDDSITIAGPGPKKPLFDSADWYFVAGDMSALPAISVNLEKLPTDARGCALIEVISRDDIQKIEKPPGFEIQWLVNPHPERKNTVLADAAINFDWLAGTPYAWVASEFNQSIVIRNHLRKQRGVSRRDMYASSYWQIGNTEDGHRQSKKIYRDRSRKTSPKIQDEK